MKFTKMQGCGNDYVYVNGFVENIATEDKPELVRKLSDRHFGIGGDGVIFINPSEKADFEMEVTVMTLRPIADRVVLKRCEAETTTKSGIVLAASAQEKKEEMEVIAVKE